ncbi:hypothetical protein CsatB_010870 [Cannabis sativa]
MHHSGEAWDEQLLTEWFNPDKVSLLARTDFLSLSNEDKLLWKFAADGDFSIKKAYWDLNEHRFVSRDLTCSRIWKFKLQERVKLFLWKLYQDALPFGCKLSAIFRSTPGKCVLCDEDYGDTIDHFISNCNIIRRLWFASPWNIRIEAFHLSNGKEVVNWLFNPPLSHSDLEEFILYGAILYYKLWSFRNVIFHNNTPIAFEEIQNSIARCVEEHRVLLNQYVGAHEADGGIKETRWGLPRPGRMKCFVDFASDGIQGAVAAVIFDDEGSVRSFGAKKIGTVMALQGEMEALIFGVNLARQFSEVGVDFLSNSFLLVTGLLEGRSPHWSFRFAFNKLCSEFDISRQSVAWISRVCNDAAHTLARWGLTHNCNGALRFWEVSPHVLTKFFSLA